MDQVATVSSEKRLPSCSTVTIDHRWIGALQPLKLGIVAGLALIVFGVCAQAFVTADHGLDRLLLGGMPGPFEGPGPLGPRWLRELSWDLTAFGSPGVVGALVSSGAGFLYLAGRRMEALYLIGSVGSGAAFGYFLKRGFGVLRPHHEADSGLELSTSFPSGHAMLASLLCASIVMLVSRTTPLPVRNQLTAFAMIGAALLSLSVGLSRIHLGLHWPTDVIAGWIAGAGWAVLFGALVPMGGNSTRN